MSVAVQETLAEELFGVPRPPRPQPSRTSPVDAATLVSEGECSPQCLVSPANTHRICHCVCRGAYHGALANTQVRPVSGG